MTNKTEMFKAELIENEIRALKTEMFGPVGYARWIFSGSDKEWSEMTIDEKYNYFNDFEDLPEGISFDMGVLRGLAIAHDLILDFEDLPEGISFDKGVLRGLAIAHDLILSDNT